MCFRLIFKHAESFHQVHKTNSNLFEFENLGPADDTLERQTPLGHRGLDGLDEALATHHSMATRVSFHGGPGGKTNHALEEERQFLAELMV